MVRKTKEKQKIYSKMIEKSSNPLKVIILWQLSTSFKVHTTPRKFSLAIKFLPLVSGTKLWYYLVLKLQWKSESTCALVRYPFRFPKMSPNHCTKLLTQSATITLAHFGTSPNTGRLARDLPRRFHAKFCLYFTFCFPLFPFYFLACSQNLLASCHWTSAPERFSPATLLVDWFVGWWFPLALPWAEPWANLMAPLWRARETLLVVSEKPNNLYCAHCHLNLYFATPICCPPICLSFKIFPIFFFPSTRYYLFYFFFASTSSCARTESSTNVKKRCTVAPFQALPFPV